MTKNSRIHKLDSLSLVSNRKENPSSPNPIHEVRSQSGAGEFALLSYTAIEAMFAPRKAWLRMLHEHNSEILETYQQVFGYVAPFCMFQFELAQRSFAAYIECQQCITESIEQQSKAANLSVLRIERTHSVIREPVDSIEHAMDVAIGAEAEPEREESWDEAIAA